MRKVIVLNNLTLDGVMQGPGRPEEDTRDGFTFGGWAGPYNDAVKGQAMGEGMSKGADLLFGRRTYEDFYGYWPRQTDNPFTPYLNQATKYVVSTTLSEPLPWQNSILLPGGPAVSTSHELAQMTFSDEIRARFDKDVERFSNLETGQSATIDAPLAMELIAQDLREFPGGLPCILQTLHVVRLEHAYRKLLLCVLAFLS